MPGSFLAEGAFFTAVRACRGSIYTLPPVFEWKNFPKADALRRAVFGMAHDHLWSNLNDLKALCTPPPSNMPTSSNGAPSEGCLYSSKNRWPPSWTRLPAQLTAVRRHKTMLMVNWPTAWSRSIRTAYRLVQEGAVGRVWQVTWRGGHGGPDELGCSDEFCQFLFDKDLNGAGAFNDYGGYGSCLCLLFMGGSPTSVVGMAGRLTKDHLPVDDNGAILMRYPQGMCRIEMTWSEAVSNVPAHDPVIYGTEGTLIAGRQVTLHTRSDDEGTVVELDTLQENGQNATDHFLHSIRSGEEPQFQTSAQLSRAAQEIMEGGLRSAMSGVEVSLPIEDHLFRG